MGFFISSFKQEALERVVRQKGRTNIWNVPENLEEDETFHRSVVWKKPLLNSPAF